jgi:hypothetical protein
MTTTDAMAHPTAAVHVAAATSLKINETGGLRPQADEQHQHAGRPDAAHDNVHPLPTTREARR